MKKHDEQTLREALMWLALLPQTSDRGALIEAQRLARWLDAMIDPAPTLPGMGVSHGT